MVFPDKNQTPLQPVVEIHPHDVDAISVQETTRLRQFGTTIKNLAATAIVAAEVLPINEAIRFGAFGAAQMATQNSLAAGAALGAATLIVEGSAALATADLLETNNGKQVIGWANDKLKKVIKPGTSMSPLVEAGVGYMGGSAVVMLAKQAEDPTRTLKQNRRHGVFTAGWMSATLTVQGVAVANGINHPGPLSISGAALGTAGVVAAANWAKNKKRNKSEQQT